jgi:hypothetical protein
VEYNGDDRQWLFLFFFKYEEDNSAQRFLGNSCSKINSLDKNCQGKVLTMLKGYLCTKMAKVAFGDHPQSSFEWENAF